MLEKNRTFFILFALFIIVGGILLSIIEQGDAIHFFSERRTFLGDSFFSLFTKVGEEIVYIGLFVGFLFVRYRYSLLVLIAGFLALVVSYILKSIFAHPRPSVYFRNEGILEQLNLIDGVYLLSGNMSFPSGHTTSAFILFGLLAFLFARKWYWNAGFFLIAVLIGISRIYLVQHFLKDVYTGAIAGVLLAILIYWASSKYPLNDAHWIDRSLLWKRRNRA